MKRAIGGSILLVGALTLSGCGGAEPSAAGGDQTLTVSAWSLETTPEFQVLADGFEKANPGVEVELVNYEAAQYDTLVTADLAAGKGPDIITQKSIQSLTTFQQGGQLRDVSAVPLPEGIGGAPAYEIDGVRYAVPYRQDSWVLFYNRALFDAAGVEYPDGTWTWDDYEDAARRLTEGLDAAGSTAKAVFQHTWQSVVQSMATAQTDGADFLSGDYAYMVPYYERTLALQEAGAQESYNTVTASQLTYQGEFGRQKSAMMLMGSWYVATLMTQRAAGEADEFEWGIAPAPQADETATGTAAEPVTFGNPTGFGINAALDEGELETAEAFLEYAASEEAALELAGIGITPALLSDAVVDAYFSVEGAPQDELSRFAVQTHETVPEVPTSPATSPVWNILADMHSAILSGSADVDDAIAEAESRVDAEVGTF
ncbi:extracellular solute-binding protein [Microbacterium sp. JZ70]